MTRNDKILLYGGVTVLTISYIISNKLSKKIFYDEILERIGSGGIKFDDLKIWNESFLLNIKAKSKPYAEYKQDFLKSQSEVLRNAMAGLGVDRDAIFGVFRNFNSKIGIAQVISFYNAKYNRSLKEDLKSELSRKSLEKIGAIVNSKPDVIFI